VLGQRRQAEEAGKQAGWKLEFTVTASSADLEAMLRDPTNEARLDGSISCPALSPLPFRVTGGTFHLLGTDPTRVHARQMISA